MTNTGSLKKSNVHKVICAIKKSGQITKPEISVVTGLTSASVHNFINELLERRIVIEEGFNVSNGGRKASLYKFNPKIMYIIGMYISLTEITTCVFDLDFNEIYKSVHHMDLDKVDVENGITKILEELDKTLLESGIPKEAFAGIGITVPGPVDFENGTVIHLVNAQNWKNIPIRSIVESRINIHTIVDKVTNGIVLHDKWMCSDENTRNLIHISITDGIGSGVLIDQKLYRGKHNVTGEIGHISVNRSGGVCNCGNHGCMELYASNSNVVKIIKKRAEKGENTSLQLDNITIESAVREARSNDPLVSDVFRSAAQYVAITIGNVIKMFDPDEIILDSYWLKELPEMYNLSINHVFLNNKMIDRSNIKISLSNTEDILIKGSATLIYDELFGNYATSLLV